MDIELTAGFKHHNLKLVHSTFNKMTNYNCSEKVKNHKMAEFRFCENQRALSYSSLKQRWTSLIDDAAPIAEEERRRSVTRGRGRGRGKWEYNPNQYNKSYS